MGHYCKAKPNQNDYYNVLSIQSTCPNIAQEELKNPIADCKISVEINWLIFTINKTY